MSRPSGEAARTAVLGSVGVALAALVTLGVRAGGGTDFRYVRRVVELGSWWWGCSGWLVLTGGAALALCCAAAAVTVAHRPGGTVWLRPLVTVGGAAAGAAALGARERIGELRGGFGLIDPSTRLDHEGWTLAVSGAALLLLAVLWALAGVAWTRRRGGGPVPVALVVAAAAVTAVVGAGLLRSGVTIVTYDLGCGMWMPGDAPPRYERLVRPAALLVSTRGWALAFAAVGSLAIVALARRGPPPARRAMLLPAALFAAGAAAFGLTRGAGDNLRNLPVPWEIYARAYVPDDGASLPAAGECDHHLVDAPLVVRDAEGLHWVDGQVLPSALQVREILEAKRKLWQSVQPQKPFPGQLLAAIAAGAPRRSVEQLFGAVHAAGFHRVDALEVLPARASPTRTLGSVPYRPRFCAVTMPLDRELPPGETWEQMVRSAERR